MVEGVDVIIIIEVTGVEVMEMTGLIMGNVGNKRGRITIRIMFHIMSSKLGQRQQHRFLKIYII